MTLTELAIEKGIEPEKAREFLREWLSMQGTYVVKGKLGYSCSVYSTDLRKGDVLIARPNMEDL